MVKRVRNNRTKRRTKRRTKQRTKRRTKRRTNKRDSLRVKKSRLNIAILFSGRLTSHDKHYKNIIDNIVQGNNVDFYVGMSTEPINDELLPSFKKLYKPYRIRKSKKNLLNIDWDNVKANKEMTPIKKNPMFMWRNRDNVMELLKKSKKKYDWIVSTR